MGCSPNGLYGKFAFDAPPALDCGMSRVSWIACAVLALALGGLGYWKFSSRTPRHEPAPAAPPAQKAQPRVAAAVSTPATPVETTVPAPAASSRQTVQPVVAPEMRNLVGRLLALDFSQGVLTPEQAALWKTNLHQLIEAGTNAIPALREFLRQNKDVHFDPQLGGGLLGYPSLRVALLSALQQIGGPAALELAVEILETTSQPHEIAQLARHLETDAPMQHRESILSATRESLAMGSSGKLGTADVGPLFDVMSQYGGLAAVTDLQQAASPYRYYAAIALANVPEGAGIPALSQMLREPNGPNKSTHTPALEALAQLAAFYPEAGARLLEQARLNQIPETLWPSIAESIAGGRFIIGNLADWGLMPQSGDRTFHLTVGNQNVLKRRNIAQFTPEQVQQSVTYLDQLMALNPGPAAVEHLQKARASLLR